MTAAADDASRGGRRFDGASPAQVRAALIPEEAAEFDRQWRAVMTPATESLDLTEVLTTLEAWRRVAWSTSAVGPARHRAMLARAEHGARTGERRVNAVSWNELSGCLGLSERATSSTSTTRRLAQ